MLVIHVWRVSKPVIYISSGLLIGLLIAGVAAWAVFVHTRPKEYFSATQLAAINFPVYIPTTLPLGYRIDAHSGTTAKDQPGVLLLTLSKGTGQKIYLSQQARIATFDYGNFYKHIIDSKTKSTPLGEVGYGYTADNRQEAIASLVTQKSWLIANGAGVQPIDLEHLLEALRKVN